MTPLNVTYTNAQGIQQVIAIPINVKGRAVSINAQRLTKISLTVDGMPAQLLATNPEVKGKNLRVKRAGKNLLVEQAGEPLLEILDFYVTEGAMLEGQGWHFATDQALVQTSEGLQAIPEAKALLLDTSALDTSALGTNGLGLGAGALGLAAGAGGGSGGTGGSGSSGGSGSAGGSGSSGSAGSAGGSGGSGGTGSVGSSTVVRGLIAAGPMVSGHQLSLDIYTPAGVQVASNVTVNADGTFEISISGNFDQLIAVVKDGSTAADYMDETTQQLTDLNLELLGMGTSATINGGKVVSININPLSTLAAKMAGIVLTGGVPSSPTANVASTLKQVAELFGVADINAITPELVIAADGTQNPNFDDSDTVSGAERYGQVLAMLSGLDAKNGGNASQTLLNLQLALSSGTNAAKQAAVNNLLTQGAVQFELNNTGGTENFANLLAAIGVAQADTTTATTSVTALLRDLIQNSSNAQTESATVLGMKNIADIVNRVQLLATGGTPSPALTAEELRKIGLLGVNNDNLGAVLQAIQSADANATPAGSGGSAANTLDKLQALANTTSAVLVSIVQFADDNANPSNTGDGATAIYVGTPPTAQNYTLVGVQGVNPSNVAAYNDALASVGITGSQSDSLAKLQNIVSAFNAILSAAAGPSPASSATPAVDDTAYRAGIPALTPEQYAAVGTQIGDAAANTASLKLLNDAVARQDANGVDSVKEIETLARIVNAVHAIAAGVNPADISQALTAADLGKLGITGVTADNFASVLIQIGQQADIGTSIDTVAELNTLVASTQTALSAISSFAQNNTASEALPDDGSSSQLTGDAGLTTSVFADAGISGVTTPSILRSIKDALASNGIAGAQANTQAKIQTLVDAYIAIRTAADGAPAVGALDDAAYAAQIPGLTAQQFAAIGVGDSTVGAQTSFDIGSLQDPNTLKLLNDAVGGRTLQAVDTVHEINNLGRIVVALQAVANGTDPATLTPALSAADFSALGISGVTDSPNGGNLDAVLKAIGTNGGNSGQTADTLAEIQTIATNATAALSDIANFAGDNIASEALPDDGNASQYVGNANITLTDFTAAGISGVTGDDQSGNLRSIKDALATSAVTGVKVIATADLQAVVNSYNKILALADGSDNVTSTTPGSNVPTVQDYINIGVRSSLIGTSPNGFFDTNRLSLLNEVVDKQARTGVDIVEEINQLATVVLAIQDTAAGLTASPALTGQDFALIGVVGVTAENLSQVLLQIGTGNVNGADTGTLSDLQNWINAINYAPVNVLATTSFAVNEDTALAITGLQVTDSDIGSGTMTVALSAAHGVITVSSVPGLNVTQNGTASVTLSGTLANINTALAANGGVSYTGVGGYFGADTVTLTATDSTTLGGQIAKTDTDTVDITLASVNDAPTGTDKTVTLLEDSAYTFSASDFGYADHEGVSSAHAFAKVKIATLPAAGTLSLTGNPITAGQEIAAADIGNLSYVPTPNASGTGFANFTFQVIDNGGTSNGGSNTDATPRSFTFNVLAVPEIVSNGVTISAATGASNSLLNAGDTATVTVTFDQAVTVTGSGTSRPSIDLEIGTSLVKAYFDAANSNLSAGQVAFTYTLLANQLDANGIGIPANSFKLNTGTIVSALAGAAPALLEHGVVAANASYKVDAVNPAASDISATLVHDSVNDTGNGTAASLTDNRTRLTTPTFTGTVEAGCSVQVQIGGTTYSSTVVGSGLTVTPAGAWTLVIPALSALTDTTSAGTAANAGTAYQLDVTSTDLAGNSSTKANAYSFNLDTQGPTTANVTGQLGLISDTGISGDNTTSQVKPVLSGTAEVGSLVKVEITVPAAVHASGKLVYTTTADASGLWTVTVTTDLSTGGTPPFLHTFTYTVTSTDVAGNSVIQTGTPFTVNTSDPLGVGSLKSGAPDDTAGLSTGSTDDSFTRNTTPVIVGQIGDSGTPYAVGDEVKVILDGKVYCSEGGTPASRLITINTANGRWSFTSETLNAGDYVVSVQVKGLAQNTYRAALNGVGFRVDTAASTLGVTGALTIDTASGTPANDNDSATKGDHLTRDTTPTLSGTAEAHSTVQITLNGLAPNGTTELGPEVLANTTVDSNGTWSVTVPSALADGTWTPSIVVNDNVGNNSAAVLGVAFTIDSTAPSLGGISAQLAGGSDTGNGAAGTVGTTGGLATDADGRTHNATPTLSGTAENGAKVDVTLVDGSNTYTYSTTAHASTGVWSIVVTDTLSDSSGGTSYTPQITVTDKAGNVSTKAGTDFVLDLVNPLASAISGALKADVTNDSATVGDQLTSVRLPVLTGTTESSSDKVEVIVGGKTYLATVTGTNWSVQVGSLTSADGLTSGSYTPQIKVTDVAGNVHTKNGTAFTVDYTAPATTFITGALTVDANTTAGANDSGTKADQLTRNHLPTLSGTGEALASLVITLQDTTVGRTTPLADVVITGITVDADGNWASPVPGSTLGNGTWTAYAAMTDAAGNTNTPKALTPFTVDRTAPTGQTGTINAASDTGNGLSSVSGGSTTATNTATDLRTRLANPTLSGTAEAGATVEVSIVDGANTRTYTTTAHASTGAWSVLVSDALSDSTGGTTYTPQIKVTDKAGNTSTTPGTAFVVDLSAPDTADIAGQLKADAANDSAATGDNLTNIRLPVLTGTTELASDKVEVIVNNKTYLATVAVNGTWSVEVGSLDDLGNGLKSGNYTPQIKVTDEAGHVTTQDGTPFAVDYTGPAASGISGALRVDTASGNPANDNDSGVKGDQLTRDTTPTLTGSGEVGATVVVSLSGLAPDGTTALTPVTLTSTTVQADGTWSVTASTLADGAWTPSMLMTDTAGNATTKVGTIFTVDRTAPSGQTGVLATSSDTGNNLSATLSDGITGSATPTLRGTAELGAAVDVTINGHTYTTIANANSGVWSVSVTDALSDTSVNRLGTTYNAWTVTATDKAGNTSSVTGSSFVLDTQAASNASISGGLSNGSTTTPIATPTLTGFVEASAHGIVQVSLAGKTYSSAVTGSGLTLDTSTGAWTLTVPPSDALLPGSYTPQITYTDAAGNVSNAVSGTAFTVVISLNGALSHDALNDSAGAGLFSGVVGNTSDNLTRTTTPKLVGQAPANSHIEIILDNVTYNSKVGDPNYSAALSVNTSTGDWELTVPNANALSTDKTYTWLLKAINISNPFNIINTQGTSFALDHSAPSVLAADLSGGIDTTVDSGTKADNVTNGIVNSVSQTQVLLSGIGEAGAAVSLSVKDGATPVGTYTGLVGNNGRWSISGPLFSALTTNTTYSVTVTLTDAAGNTTAPTAISSFTYDATAPTFTSVVVSGVDANGSIDNTGTTAQTGLLTAGDLVLVTATSLEKINVTGRPTYALTLGSNTVSAVYDADASLSADATGKTMVFKYTVRTNDLDSNGLTAVAASMGLGSGSIRDDAANAANLTSAGVPALAANTLTVDAKAPSVSTVAITSVPGPDNTYVAGDLIVFKVVFSEAVTFSDNNVGVNFKIGSTLATAAYDSANVLNTGTDKYFSYTVSALTSDTDTNGIAVGTNPVVITGNRNTSIRDAAQNDAVLGYTTVTLADASNTQLVDTTPPAITIGRSGNYTLSQNSATTGTNSETFTFTFTENPVGFALSDVLVKNASNTTLVAGTDFVWGALSAVTASGAQWVATATLTPQSAWAYTGNITVSVPIGTGFTDAAGNANAASNVLALAVDNQVPNNPSLALSNDTVRTTAGAANTLTTNTDKITYVTSLTTSGSEVSGTVQYRVEQLVDIADASGTEQNIGGVSTPWGSITDYNSYMSTSTDAAYKVYTRQIDLAGNTSTGTSSLSFVKDTATPNNLTIGLSADTGLATLTGNGTAGTDTITSQGAIQVTGFESGAMVQYKIGQGSWTNATLNAGLYDIPDGSTQGSITVSVRQVDTAGNISDVQSFLYQRDTVAPVTTATGSNALTGALAVDNASDVTPMDNLAASFNDSGIQGDHITADHTPTLSGTGEPLAWVSVTLTRTTAGVGGTGTQTSALALTPVQIDVNGSWTATVPAGTPLADGTWTPSVVIQDAAGNANSTPVSLSPFTIDTTAPVLSITAATLGGTRAGTNFIFGTTQMRADESLLVTFSFDDALIADSFTAGDLSVTGGVLGNFAQQNATTWTATYTPVNGIDAGTGGIVVTANAFQNLGAIANTAAVSKTIGYDTSAPNITGIVRAVAVPGATGSSGTFNPDSKLNRLETDAADDAVTFTAKFSQSLMGVATSNFVVTDLNGSPLTGATVSSVSGGNADVVGGITTYNYTVSVSGLNAASVAAASGLRLALANNTGITDAAGNKLVDMTYGNGEAYTIDLSAPSFPSLTSSSTVGLAKPVIAGRAEPATTVQITIGSVVWSVLTDTNGVWTLNTDTASPSSGGPFAGLTNGTATAISIAASDSSGNVGTTVNQSLTYTAGTPAITTTGSSNDSSPIITGTAPVGVAFVRVTIAGASYDVAVSSGLWLVDTGTVVPTVGSFNAIENGNYTLTAQATSAVNGTLSGGVVSSVLQIDTIAPGAPVVDGVVRYLADNVTETGVYSHTSDSTPVLRGSASAGSKVRVTLNASTYEILADDNGVWSLNTQTVATTGSATTTQAVRVSGSGALLSAGAATGSSYLVSAVVVDAAGNNSAQATRTVVFDNTAPAAPTIDTSATPLTSGNTSPIVGGTGEPLANITVFVGGAYYQTTVTASGRWSVNTASETPVSGAYAAPAPGASLTAYVRQTDGAGNINTSSTGAASNSWGVSGTYTYRTDYPAITSSDFTKYTSPTISGTSPVGSTIELTVNGSTFTVSTGADGKWRVNTATTAPNSGSFVALSDDSNLATAGKEPWLVTATISAGTGVGHATTQNLSVDLTNPALLSIDTVAGDDTINLLEKGNTSITGAVEVGCTVTLNLAGNARTALVKPDGTWRYLLTAEDYAAIGQSNSVGDLLLQATATDRAGNTLVRGKNITIDTLAPVVDLDRASADANFAVPLKLKNVAVGLDNGEALGITDASVVEASNVNTVRIGFMRLNPTTGVATGFVPQDGANEQLLVGDQILALDGSNVPVQLNFAGVTWFIDYAAGAYTLTAASDTPASVASAQGLLRNVRYINKNTATALLTDDNREISFVLTDKAGNANSKTVVIISADTQAPVLDLNTGSAGIGRSASVSGATFLAAPGAISLNEASSGNNKLSAIDIMVVGLQDGAAEKMLVDGATGSLAAGWSANGAGFVNGSTFTQGGVVWAVHYDSSSGSFSVTPSAGGKVTDAEAQSLVAALKYQNTAGTPTDGARSFKVVVTDGVGNSMATAAESMLSINNSAPMAAVDLAPAVKAETDPLFTLDTNGDGVLGDQFTIRFSEAVNVTGITNTANWNGGNADAMLGAGWTIAANNTYTVGADAFAKTYTVTRGTGGNLSTASQLFIANSQVVDTAGTSATGNTTLGVRFIMLRNNAGVAFDLGEVSIFVGGTNVALNKTATVGSNGTYSGLSASSVLDGNTSTGWGSANANANSWFQIDLGDYYALDKVVVSGRSGFEARMSNTAIYASTTDMSPGTLTNTAYNSNPAPGQAILLGSIGAVANGAAAQTFGTGGVAFTNAISTAAGASGAVQAFNMTDILARSAVTPPLNIATDNTVNASEKAAGVAMAYDMGSPLLAGETVKIYRNGVDITNAPGVAISGNAVGSSTVTFTLNSAAWPEGAQSITVRHIDAAGNVSPVGFAKAVTVDTAIGSITSVHVTTDSDNVASAGDVITVTFSEAVSSSGSSATLTLPAGVFGTGATVTAVDAVSNKATTYRVTLGTGATLAAGDVLTFTGLQDAAGNTAGSASITVPADVYSAPTSITVANVGTASGAWNVIDSADRSSTGVTVNFTKAAANDVVKLVIDGDTANPITHTLTAGEATAGSINFAALNWGADGTRSITASIQRGSGTVVNSAVRKVQVSADSDHWSQINDVIWLDPDALTATAGSKIDSWADSSGRGVSATQATAAAQPWVQTNEFGGKMVWVNGGQAMEMTSALIPTGTNYNLTLITTMQMLTNGSWAYVLAAGSLKGWALGSTANPDPGGGNNTLVLDSFAGGAQADGGLTQANSISFNRWAAISGQVQHGGTRASQVYSNGALVMQGSGYTTQTDMGLTGRLVIGAINSTASGNASNAMLGDQIATGVLLGNAARMEIETYTSAKFGSGVPTALSASNTYNLSASSVASTIVDDRLDISTQVSNDRVTVKGADHVNTGAGADTVLAQDLAFRLLDGGLGFDTFALDSGYTAGTFILTDYVSNARGMSHEFSAPNSNFAMGSPWTAGDSTTVVTDTTAVTDPSGGNTADVVNFGASTSSLARNFTGLTVGHTYTFEAYVRLPNMLTNGGFTGNASGWTLAPAAGGAVGVTNNALVLNQGSDITANMISQAITTEVGKTYTVKWTTASSTGGSVSWAVQARAGSTTGTLLMDNYSTETSTSSVSRSGTFTATTTTTFIRITDRGTPAAGADLIVDDLAVSATFNLELAISGGTLAAPVWNQFSGETNYTNSSGLSATNWGKLAQSFTATSTNASIWLGDNSEAGLSSTTQATGSFYVWGERLLEYTADDTRVNAAGFHKLQGFEKLDFFQAAGKQTVQLNWVDVDQLAEKGLAQGTNVTVNATTSNVFMALGSNDWLDVVTSGLGNVTYGFYQDANGTTYNRKYSGTVGTDTTALYVRGGDDVPDFGAASTTAVVSSTSVAVDFGELMQSASAANATNWSIASAGSSISGWSVATSAGKSVLQLNGSFNTSAYLDVTYNGTAIMDNQSDQLHYKGLAIGLASNETIDLSGKGSATNTQAAAGYAIFGNDGADTIIGTQWDDLILGGAGNDILTGGLGADTFRAIQFEGGTDTVTDFNRLQGDTIDLRGILQGTAIDGNLVFNADGTIDAANSLPTLAKYLDFSTSGNNATVKVDDNGLSGFLAPTYQVLLQNANTAGNMSAMDLQTLINQGIILI